MTSYDDQYQTETDLFGAPYAEFEQFIKAHATPNATALDLGCGQGRDALMLARHGYAVTGVDNSQVGIDQMVARGAAQNLTINGVVADLFTFKPPAAYDVIVLDSILHFGKADKAKELALLDTVAAHLNPNGYLCLFIHKSDSKEKVLNKWLSTTQLTPRETGYIDYTYTETQSGFSSKFQYYMLIVQNS